MTATAPQQSKVTSTSANVDWELFHRQFDDALARVRAQLGQDYPLYIGRDAVPSGGPPIVDASPIDTSMMLGRFATRSEEHTSELQSLAYLVCRLLLEKKNNQRQRKRMAYEKTHFINSAAPY